MKKVVVGMSGGVDSSVAALLCKEAGYEVIGLFMKNWHDDSVTISDECPWIEDSNDAMLVAEKLGIPFQTIDLSATYKERIVDYMFDEYEKGRTPNPDVLCNREIKFDVFLDVALSLGADYVATGHYCRKASTEKNGQTFYRLLSGVDPNKDQSYFLCQLNQYQLSKTLFPIGELHKDKVRAIAKDNDLITADKRDSQGLCFIGKVKLPDFLKQKLAPKEGDIIEIPTDAEVFEPVFSFSADTLTKKSNKVVYQPEMGKVVGHHEGAHYFTNGQRKGLAVGGTPEPLFVIGTEVEKNIVYVGQGKDHPGLYADELWVNLSDIHWLRTDRALNVGEQLHCEARIRYRQSLANVQIEMMEDGLLVKFDTPQFAITSGQFVAFYESDELLGSGVIT
ncbi:MAG: tRNA 2-thiouridine(34) synthase MnmA [Psychroflexus sp.]|nr:tRNA 2-thiouridine(34) synthase MnmA [Psychroflexus sp.]